MEFIKTLFLMLLLVFLIGALFASIQGFTVLMEMISFPVYYFTLLAVVVVMVLLTSYTGGKK